MSTTKTIEERLTELEEAGYVGPAVGAMPRKVLKKTYEKNSNPRP